MARPRAGWRVAEQLALSFRGLSLDLRRGHGAVLLPRLPEGAAGSKLAESTGPRGDARHNALLAQTGGGRLPCRRPQAANQGRPVSGQPAQPRLSPGYITLRQAAPGVLNRPSRDPRGHSWDTTRSGGVWGRSAPDWGAVSAHRSPCPLLRGGRLRRPASDESPPDLHALGRRELGLPHRHL